RIGSDGSVSGPWEGIPQGYGYPFAFANSPVDAPGPLLLAECPAAPTPVLLADERPARPIRHTALLIRPSGFRIGGRFRLPAGAATPGAVSGVSREEFWTRNRVNRMFRMQPGGRATW